MVLAIVIVLASATSGPWWWKRVFASGHQDVPGVTRFVGSCEPFRVYAQNRWEPMGAALKASPDVASRHVGGLLPNLVVFVDGWVHARVAYPTNSPPWDSDVWFHVADGSGWVSFAAVRETPTAPDPTGLADGGAPAPTAEACHGAIAS